MLLNPAHELLEERAYTPLLSPPAPEGVSYVADNGEEMFTHTYGSIVRCCIAVDGVSFAYTAHHEKDRKYYCHVFQALTFDEVSQ